jgi:hypothetical protein
MEVQIAGRERQSAVPSPFLTGVAGCLALLVAISLAAGYVWSSLTKELDAPRLRAGCQGRLRQLVMGVLIYTQDYDDRLPLGAEWDVPVMEYVSDRAAFKIAPGMPPHGYAFNTGLSGIPLSHLLDLAKTPVLFESSNAAPGSADPFKSFVTLHKNEGGIGWADGQASFVAETPSAAPILKPWIATKSSGPVVADPSKTLAKP